MKAEKKKFCGDREFQFTAPGSFHWTGTHLLVLEYEDIGVWETDGGGADARPAMGFDKKSMLTKP